MRVLYLLAIAGLALGQAQGQFGLVPKLPKEAADLKLNCEVQRAALRNPLLQLREHYLQRLATLQEQAQQGAVLAQVLAVKAEIERVESGAASTEKTAADRSAPAALNEARAIYEREKASLTARLKRSEEPLMAKYHAALEAMLLAMTQADRLDDALVVKTLLAESRVSAAVGLPPKRGLGDSSRGELEFSVQVDGTSHLYLRGSEIWYDHSEGKAAPVGRHNGEFPTTLNGEDWLPEWNGKQTSRHDTGVLLPVSDPPAKINSKVLEGRGTVEIIEQATAKNDYTAKIALHDMNEDGKRFFGSKWLDFRLTW